MICAFNFSISVQDHRGVL